MAQRCISCNKELANGVTEAYDARKQTCADWGGHCQKHGAASPPHDAATEESRRLERVYTDAHAAEARADQQADAGAERAAHRAVLTETAERVAAGDGPLSADEERRVAEKARKATK